MYFDRKRNVDTEKMTKHKQMLDIFKIPLRMHLTAIIKRSRIVNYSGSQLEIIYAFKCRKKKHLKERQER